MNVQQQASLTGYDFVDFGCGTGGSMEFAANKLGGTRGVGLDIDPRKVAASQGRGFAAFQADATLLDPKQLGTVRFAVMANFLERLPNMGAAEKSIRTAVALANEFVLIRQPFFDADEYLKALGLKLHWSDWRATKNRMRTSSFRVVLDDLLNRRKIRRYVLFHRTRIVDSDDPSIHPLSSPADQSAWDAALHPSKPYYKFGIGVFREVGALIHTRDRKLSEPPRRFLLQCEVSHDSATAKLGLE